MAIQLPVTQSKISTTGWGIPITNAVNLLDATIRQYPTETALLADNSAPHGCQAIALDTFKRWTRYGSSWRPTWPRLVGYTTGTPGTTFSNTVQDVPGSAISLPYYGGNRYYAEGQVCLGIAGVTGWVNLYITDSVGTVLVGPAQYAPVSNYITVVAQGWWVPTGANSLKLRVLCNPAGQTGNLASAFSFSVTDFGPV